MLISVLLLGCGRKTEAPSAANRYKARVEWIHDGDTVTVEDEKGAKHKLRMYAIDAPELAQRSGKESMKNLIKILPKNKWVKVEVENIDRYQREVATVYLEDVNINRKQIETGHAWHYVKYDKKFMNDYSQAEKRARKEKLGLWRDANPQPPWEWRQKKREKK
ncbi:MAG: thermonuclease family protein [Acidaminococcaceae bacterium]|nr:thermonuclease family protein [Acidaminococcaceae bacterium]